MRTTLILIAAACAAAGCTVQNADENDAPTDTEAASEQPGVAQTPMPVEPDGGIGDGAPPLEDMVLGQESGPPETDDSSEENAGDTLPKSFPTAIRGTWRESDGASLTKAQCDNTVADNMGKVLIVQADGYSLFETGGRFIAVKAREPGRIRAVFDTTYADKPTREELEFTVDPVERTLTVRNFDTDDRATTTYRRCPR